ncbi:LOW QUALITY PROTEIN: hephaestin-like protein 1 [Takifugu rubripes]|uniref:LOW QUALITY PROTEIN: hephaestin-like protein 1 n=1 Tax=Takifugu rubripes TaxID=31033 RepID=UPI001145ADF5|nr:LOW QUALITY PROTEIN: hephaestin-like protein 1 [Takifugu rubripes]
MERSLRLLASCLLCVLCSGAGETRGRERVYYIGIIEGTWNYAPSGKNLLNGKDIANDEHASTFLESGPQRIGRVYKKAMFRQYTDRKYSQQIPGPAWLGFLGPVLRAEVGDVILVHLKNFASRNYSIHPHGVFYEKDAEGALYPDGTSKAMKMDDAVPPGGSYTYRWEVRPEFAPTDDDANCLTWVYHSHVDAPRDIASGLIGALLTCKKGILTEAAHSAQGSAESVRNDVDQDVFLMFNVVDENLSWYLQDNIRSCCDPAGVDLEDADFMESNKMHAINGYMFGNLPRITLCQGRAVAWHLFGMGNEVDIHSAFFHGNTLLDRGHRTDVLSLFPATFATAEMVPKARGKWLLTCQVNDHFQAGMQAFYEVKSCNGVSGTTLTDGVVRNYYMAVEKVLWDYAPSGQDLINNINLTEADSASGTFFGRDGNRIGGQYLKVMYKEYTDSSFTTTKPQTPESQHLALFGPVLRAEEGDTIKVTLMNKADRSYSIQPHGLFYESLNEDEVSSQGSDIGPGKTFTYTWQVKDGPSPSDPSCIPYLYFSATDPVADTNSGLMGPLLVCKKGSLAESGLQKGVDKEFFLLFSVMDENLSQYLRDNIDMFAPSTTDPLDEDFMESNMMHAINGRMYGNLAGLEMCAGDKVTWYTFGLGTEVDIHGVYFEGNTFKKQSTTRDTLNLFPHTTTAVSMQPDEPGVYEVNCRVTDHYSAGMRQQYRVNLCPQREFKHARTPPTKVVQYFISAEEIEWDFSPQRDWELELYHTTEEDSPGNTFLGREKNRIGSRYKKVVYREYTDDSFTMQKDHQQHLGILGPIIRAEVGEQIVITFKNKASRPYSITAHGVKASGAHVPNRPGKIIELTWDIPESSGPGVSDPNCISYAYYSNVDFIQDLYSGLLGPLVICRPGTLRGEGSDRQRADVEKEFALLFMVHDENQSWYLEDNIRKYLNATQESATFDQGFHESNMMHGINGRLYANLQGLEMTQGHKVDWYLLGMGNEVDMHTVHFHAETFTYKTDSVHRADVFDLFPGTFQTVEMVAGNPGTWLLHCHVTDHIHSGMETTFTIKGAAQGTGSSLDTSLLLLVFALISALH